MELLLKYFPDISEKQRGQFAQLQGLYSYWNAQINVISRKDMDGLMIHHVLHSLAIAKYISFKPGTQLIDLGTGGGFPAIPLAIFFPEVEVIAVDSIAKKIKVTEAIADSLELDNLRPLCARVEELQFEPDFVVNRAVASLSTLYHWTKNLISHRHKNQFANGLISLKGGDLRNEISEFGILNRKSTLEQKPLSLYFEEDYFETKSLVYASW
ncbi:MAG: 16S rRNA (guanine(527)-N(7))-methyltransferase RsmG [Flavobacteriaceae bacterium]|nr:16S rRNA (guanine(527)-N(7))-methyltransferase RsmG [Flavobacteriaceae bacterium]